MSKYPAAYIEYLVQFHAARDYFECHEVLEEYWKQHPDDRRSELWVGLIQLAVGAYHERRGNNKGASRMYEECARKLERADAESELGIDQKDLQYKLRQRLEAVRLGQGFADMELLITDKELGRLCGKLCGELELVWGAPSPMDDEALIHRHIRRDRSDVIAERQAALVRKQKERR